MVFQSYALYPHMTVFENMAFALKLKKVAAAEIDRRVRQAADILDIAAVLDRTPKQLSGGQRQRVAVGRAIVRQPQVFLFDEPLSNLDAKLRVQTRREISKLHRQLGATMVYVTHDQVEAMTMGDRIVVLDKGRVQQIDTPLNLYDHPANRFVAGFIGSPAMNFIDGRVTSAGGSTRFEGSGGSISMTLDPGRARALAAHGDRAVVLGVRPEDVYVASGPRPATATAEATVHLEAVEPMGNEIFLHAKGASHELTARVAPQAIPEAGKPVTLAFDAAKVHFFDAESGVAVR
jgi:multiple sugar transport system ATP-binding protein